MTRCCTTRAAHHLPGRLPVKGALSAAAATASRWAPGETITVAFLAGALPALMDEVVAAAREIEKYANLKFAFVGPEAGSAMVRVDTVQDGSSWSLVGKACLLETDQTQPTMNLGWEDDPDRTLHELMHAADFVHEDQLPDRRLHLDRAKVYAYFGGPPNHWSKAEVDAQVLDVDREPLSNCGFDPLSRMAYWLDPDLFLPGFASEAIPETHGLSPGDTLCLGLTYPFATAPTTTVPEPPPVTPTQTAVSTIAATAFGANLWSAIATFLAAAGATVSENVDAVKLAAAVGADVVSGKTPVAVLADVIARSEAIFPNPASRPGIVEVLNTALFFARLAPTHAVA